MTDLISVIVATYERPDALDAVLRSLARQTDATFEVIVADDGSGPAAARVVADWRSRLGVRLDHVWHEDRGFRLAEIRNRAISASRGVYCIFLDGDCLARPNFVAAHRRLAEPGWFVTGNRLLLSRELSERILTEGLEVETWGWRDWLGCRLRGEVNRMSPLATLPLGRLRRLGHARWRGARGSNMAFWREDLERLDGFDSAFLGWGREDSDIFVRMMHAGRRRKDGRFATGVLHLWHPEADRSNLEQNDAQLREVIASGRVRARRGLSGLGKEDAMSRARGHA
ncbi:MAG TPA: glycosyltransferase family 2 protein [Xanthobacteraceae bacterium]|jgi:glycosyltransferase involved in cell wall biosynthesis|nr:glycosyltransferase family 2 protein [Xanthobacteraceae bacterium]